LLTVRTFSCSKQYKILAYIQGRRWCNRVCRQVDSETCERVSMKLSGFIAIW